jgi:hypothetical protein
MFRRNRSKAQEAPPAQAQAPQQAAPRMGAGGYQVVEIPTYHGGKRKVVVYTSDASGRIIKTIRRK